MVIWVIYTDKSSQYQHKSCNHVGRKKLGEELDKYNVEKNGKEFTKTIFITSTTI